MNTNAAPMIEATDLSRIYENSETIKALDEVNFVVMKGELVAVMGPSGSGKSTLLNIVGALDLPTSGMVCVNGKDITRIRDKDKFRSKSVGFMFQLHNLIPTLSARENVEVPMMGELSPGKRRRRAEEILDLVGLSDRMEHLPNQLSGGQRQRVAVARALANNPPLILADEPTGSLDSTAGSELMRLIQNLNRSQGTTFMIVTHDISVARQTERVLVMSDGRIVREDIIGSPIEEDLKSWQNSDLGKRILNGDPKLEDLLDLSSQQIEVLNSVMSL